MPKPFYLITAFGPDRPGMVAQLTRVVFELGGNIEDASMTRLGGEFTIMLVAGLQPAAGRLLMLRLPALQRSLRLTLQAKPVAAGRTRKSAGQPTHLVSIYGTDRPGIVYRTAQAIADLRLNITHLHTKALQRALPTGRQAGKPLYIMLLELQIPSRTKATALRRRLDQVSRVLKLDVTLHAIEPVTL